MSASGFACHSIIIVDYTNHIQHYIDVLVKGIVSLYEYCASSCQYWMSCQYEY